MEKRKNIQKSTVILSGVIACLIMIVIVLSFLSNTITGNSIKIKDKEKLVQINNNLENINQNESNNTESNEKMSGNGIAYVCVDPDGNIFRSETPCR